MFIFLMATTSLLRMFLAWGEREGEGETKGERGRGEREGERGREIEGGGRGVLKERREGEGCESMRGEGCECERGGCV